MKEEPTLTGLLMEGIDAAFSEQPSELQEKNVCTGGWYTVALLAVAYQIKLSILIEIVPRIVESGDSRRTAPYATWTC